MTGHANGDAIRRDLGEGFNLAEGARLLAHRKTVERVQASERLALSRTERHNAYPRQHVYSTRRPA